MPPKTCTIHEASVVWTGSPTPSLRPELVLQDLEDNTRSGQECPRCVLCGDYFSPIMEGHPGYVHPLQSKVTEQDIQAFFLGKSLQCIDTLGSEVLGGHEGGS